MGGPRVFADVELLQGGRCIPVSRAMRLMGTQAFFGCVRVCVGELLSSALLRQARAREMCI